MKWAIGTVIAVLAAMIVLPAIATAHEASIQGEPSCTDFFDGSWHVTWTLTTTASGGAHLTAILVQIQDGAGGAPDLGLPQFSGLDGSGDEVGTATTTYTAAQTPSDPLNAFRRSNVERRLHRWWP